MKASQMPVVGLQVLQHDRHVAHSSLYFGRYDLCEVHFASHAEKAFLPPPWAGDLFARKRLKRCSFACSGLGHGAFLCLAVVFEPSGSGASGADAPSLGGMSTTVKFRSGGKIKARRT